MLDNCGILKKNTVYEIASEGRDFYVLKRDGKSIHVAKAMCTTDFSLKKEENEEEYEYEFNEYEN